MDARQYNAWSQPLRQKPGLLRALTAGNKALTYLGYVMYPLLLVLLVLNGDPFLLRCILVPGISFVAVSVFRKAFNKPRPYETLDIQPLIVKDTKGKSFPSRHAFSMFMIALCWLYWMPPVGIALCIAGIAMGIVRVLGGVHYPVDVVAGMLVAVVCGVVGFWIIP